MKLEPDAAPACIVWVGDGAIPGSLAGLGVQVRRAPATASGSEIAAVAPDLVVLSGPGHEHADRLSSELARADLGTHLALMIVGDEQLEVPSWARSGLVAHASGGGIAIASAIASTLERLSEPDRTASPKEAAEIMALTNLDQPLLVACEDPPFTLLVDELGAYAPDRFIATVGTGKIDVTISPRPPGRTRVVKSALPAPAAKPAFGGVPIAVVGSEHAELCEALTAHGADARMLGDAALDEARAMDPALIVVPASALAGPIGLALANDARLAFTSVLVIEEKTERSVPGLSGAARELVNAELAVRARIADGERVIDRVELLGTARWLKVAGRRSGATTMQVRSPAGIGEVVLDGGRVKDATFAPRDGAELKGKPALQQILGCRWGTVLLGSPADVARGRPEIALARERAAPPRPRSVPPPPPKIAASVRSKKSTAPKGGLAPIPAAIPPPKPLPLVAPAPKVDLAAEVSALAREEAEELAVATLELPEKSAPPGLEAPAFDLTQLPKDLLPAAEEPKARSAPPPDFDDDDDDDEPQATTKKQEYVPSEPPPSEEKAPRIEPPETLPENPVVVPAGRERSQRGPWLAVLLVVGSLGAAAGVWLYTRPPAAPPRAPAPLADEPEVAQEPPAEPPPEPARPPEPPPEPVAQPEPPRALDEAAIAALRAEVDDARDDRDWERMKERANALLAAVPNDHDAAYAIALACNRLGEQEQALEWAQRAMEYGPGEQRPRVLAGDVLWALRRRREAREVWRQCMRDVPSAHACEQNYHDTTP